MKSQTDETNGSLDNAWVSNYEAWLNESDCQLSSTSSAPPVTTSSSSSRPQKQNHYCSSCGRNHKLISRCNVRIQKVGYRERISKNGASSSDDDVDGDFRGGGGGGSNKWTPSGAWKHTNAPCGGARASHGQCIGIACGDLLSGGMPQFRQMTRNKKQSGRCTEVPSVITQNAATILEECAADEPNARSTAPVYNHSHFVSTDRDHDTLLSGRWEHRKQLNLEQSIYENIHDFEAKCISSHWQVKPGEYARIGSSKPNYFEYCELAKRKDKTGIKPYGLY